MFNFPKKVQKKKARKLKDENRAFQPKWTSDYYFIENPDKKQ